MSPRVVMTLVAGLLLAFGGIAVGLWRLRSPELVAAEPPRAPAQESKAEDEETDEESDESEPTTRVLPELPSSDEARAAPWAEAKVADAEPSAASDAPSAAPTTTPEQIHAALRETPVVMYTTKWCQSCERARAFFRANGVPFEERDVEASERYRADLLRVSGATSVPLIDVDGVKMTGFGEQKVTTALRDSVARRLGVSGLAIQAR